MNCSVYTPAFLPYRNSHPHPLSSFRIDDILKTPPSVSPTLLDPTALWSSFAAQLLAYSPELLSVATAAAATTTPMTISSPTSTEISPSMSSLISPQKHLHHRHQYHPYLSISRHSPTAKLQHDPTSVITTSTNKNNYQHTLSPLSIKDKLQHPQLDRKDCLSSHHSVPPTSAAAAAAAAAYWPYLYTRCNSSTTGNVSRRKGGQIRFSAEQSLQLEKKFEISQYLSPVERKQIAKTLQLSERQIKTWFQNRRAKHRRSAATVTKKDMDKSGSSPQQSDDEDDDDDDIDVDDNVDEEHATSSNSN